MRREHIVLDQFIKIHRYIIKNTYTKEDKYQLERRECYLERDKDGFKYYILQALADESELHEQVMLRLKTNITGFSTEQFEKDAVHYKMNRLCAD